MQSQKLRKLTISLPIKRKHEQSLFGQNEHIDAARQNKHGWSMKRYWSGKVVVGVEY